MKLTEKKSAEWRRRARRGTAALEFALTLPIWMTFMLGLFDGGYYLLVNEKVDRIAYTTTDIVTQYNPITTENMKDIFTASSLLMNPFSFSSNGGVVVVSSFYLGPSSSTIQLCWNYSSANTSAVPTTTHPTPVANDIVISGATLTLKNGQTLTVGANENVIVSEVTYKFTPVFLSSGLFPSATIYRAAVYKPRLSLLITVPTT